MKVIDVIGKPCPIPVIESKKALAEDGVDGVLVKVDNYVAVQNLGKMASGLGYDFSYAETGAGLFEVSIGDRGDGPSVSGAAVYGAAEPGVAGSPDNLKAPQGGVVVAIGRNTMGDGEPELGKTLIKGFIYALSELPAAPEFVIFYNSGVFLTADGANTIDDLKKLVENGTKILTCGTCVSYYGLSDPAVGNIANMYDITEKLANAGSVINI